jgi:hypothetical protein
VHHGTSPLKILQQNSVKRQVMKLGKKMVEEVHEMFLAQQSHVISISIRLLIIEKEA